jgi:hypothetical protein
LKKKICLGIEGLLCVLARKRGKKIEMFYGGVEVCPQRSA